MDSDEGVGVVVDLGFDEAVARTRLVMRARGFSILSEMPAPLDPTGKSEVGRSHLFMAMWTRPVQTANLGGEGLDVGDHLACNFVVFEQQDRIFVASLDPSTGLDGWQPADLGAEAAESIESLLAQIAQLSGP